MKRLFALLLLAVAPAFAQEYAPAPIYDPTVVQTYTPTTITNATIQNVNQSGGTPLTLYDDGTTYTPIQLPFDFYFFGSLFNSVYISQNGFISFTSNANGCCSGNQLPFFSDDSYYNVNNSIFAMWSDLADFNTPGNPYYKSTGNIFTVGWYGIEELGTANKFNFEISLFSDSSFSIAYGDFDYAMASWRQITSGFQGDTADEFYTIYYGSDPTVLENTTFKFTSSGIVPPPPPPPQFLFWNRVAGEYETFTLTEQAVVRYGAEGVYAYQTLEAGTYDCGNSIFGDPIGGVVKSCEIGSNEPPPPPPPVVDCATSPLDPTCIIDDLIDDDPVMLAVTPVESISSAEEETEDAVVEELMAELEAVAEDISAEEESLEELLEEKEVAAAEEKQVAETKELVNEEKAAALSDSISKNTLEAALAIAGGAESSSLAVGSASAEGSTSTSSSGSTRSSDSSAAATTEQSTSDSSQSVAVAETAQESSNAGDASMELLETGRVMGQEALAATMAGAEASAAESVSEAESIALISSVDSAVASSATVETINSIEIESVVETVVADTSSVEVSSEVVAFAETTTTDSSTMGQDQSQEFKYAEGNSSIAMEQETEDFAMAVVNASVSEQKTFDDESNKDAEMTNAMVDPGFAMANTFNQPPSLMNLEILGIVKPIEEKSDAELRAEQVVAANKEEQDAINANYMEADQSGILAAIGSETDVSAYRSAMLQDANAWYKPEDIYKNIVIKDNVRGSYFLEKGNTDTYKKMVEEQYKNE